MLNGELRIRVAGDSGLLVEFGDTIEWSICKRVHLMNRLLASACVNGIVETIPSFRSLFVVYDPMAISPGDLERELLSLSGQLNDSIDLPSRCIYLPVCFDGSFGPDLEDVALHTGLDPSEVLSRFCAATYRVFFMGFAPGNGFFGGLPPELATPRLDRPRLHVPVGSIGIGGRQMGIYSIAGPGGFRLIGQTPVALYDPARTAPSLLRPGDQVCFEPVDAFQFELLQRDIAAGRYQPRISSE